MTEPLFFYGTLQHVPLLETVLGRDASDVAFEVAVLPDHSVDAVAEGPEPMLSRNAGAEAQGVVVRNLSDQDRARLDFFEGCFDYDPTPRTLTSGESALVYVAADHRKPRGTWQFEAWETRWAPLGVAFAREVMSYFGRLEPAEVGRQTGRIRARAQSVVNAHGGRHGQGTLAGRIDIQERERAHLGFFALDRMTLRHETFRGAMSDPMTREVFITSDASIVLPYDPVRDRVLLVEQIRMGPLGRGDPVCWQLEPVAGLIDPGETPEEAARRETHEEAGLRIGDLLPVAQAYASPGGSTDFHYIYVGLCDIPDDLDRIGGNPDEGEDIRLHLMSFGEVLDMAEDQRTANTPLTLAVYWLARHRDRVRASA